MITAPGKGLSVFHLVVTSLVSKQSGWSVSLAILPLPAACRPRGSADERVCCEQVRDHRFRWTFWQRTLATLKGHNLKKRNMRFERRERVRCEQVQQKRWSRTCVRCGYCMLAPRRVLAAIAAARAHVPLRAQTTLSATRLNCAAVNHAESCRPGPFTCTCSRSKCHLLYRARGCQI